MGEQKLQRQRWSDLSARWQRLIVVGGTVQVALAASAWWDLARRPASQVRGPKWCWAAAIAVNFVGPISYFTVGRRPADQWEKAVGQEGDAAPAAVTEAGPAAGDAAAGDAAVGDAANGPATAERADDGESGADGQGGQGGQADPGSG